MNNDAQIKLILDSLDLGIILTGPNNKIIFINDFFKDYLGVFSYLNLEISDLFEVFFEDKIIDSNSICGYSEAQTNGVIFNREPLVLANKQNQTKAVSIKTVKSEVLYKSGITSLIIIKDIEEKAELEKMKIDFSSQAVHILRTPLTVIRDNLSSIIKSEVYHQMNDKEKKNLDEINFELNQLKNLIQNLITVNQIENEKVDLQTTSTGILQLVDQSVKELTDIAEKTSNKILVVPPLYNLPDIKLDVLKIVSVFKAILMNSLGHTSGGQIIIKISKEDKYLKIELEDNGEGISETGLKYIFNKFYHSKKNPLIMEQGLGIGLYYCKKIIELHQGKINVLSKKGEGTKVTIQLPF